MPIAVLAEIHCQAGVEGSCERGGAARPTRREEDSFQCRSLQNLPKDHKRRIVFYVALIGA